MSRPNDDHRPYWLSEGGITLTEELRTVPQTGCQELTWCGDCNSPVVNHPEAILGHRQRVHKEVWR